MAGLVARGFSGEPERSRQGEERPNPYYHILDNPLMRLDIDDASDMALAGAVLERGLFDFEEAL